MNAPRDPAVVCSRLADGDFDVASFSCGDDEIDAFLHGRARDEDAVGRLKTWVLHPSGGREILAFVAIGMGHVNLQLEDHDAPGFVGAVHIAYLGASARHAGRGNGSNVILWALHQSRHYSRDIGCRGLALNCRPHRLGWYRDRLSFREYGKPTRDETGPLHRMFLDNRRSGERAVRPPE